MPSLTFIVGTRPECIKVAPVVAECKRRGISHQVIHTGQHSTLWLGTGITPTINLGVGSSGDLGETGDRLRRELAPHLREGWVVVLGDTLTAVIGAEVGRDHDLPVYHIEAGVRSGDRANPFPEEGYRIRIDEMATAGACPTLHAQSNLRVELPNVVWRYGTGPKIPVALDFPVTGNPGVDACLQRQRPVHPAKRLDYLLVTLHRRESFGVPLQRIVQGLLEVADHYPDLEIHWPLHPNPAIRAAIPATLPPGIRIGPPLAYTTFLTKLAHAGGVLTDSGGVQEDAATLGIPAAIAREVTDRPESIESGHAVLAGRTTAGVERGVLRVLGGHLRNDPGTVFGDGQAANRILDHWLGLTTGT